MYGNCLAPTQTKSHTHTHTHTNKGIMPFPVRFGGNLLKSKFLHKIKHTNICIYPYFMQSVLQMVERLQRLFEFFLYGFPRLISNRFSFFFVNLGPNCVQAKKLLICDSIQYDID